MKSSDLVAAASEATPSSSTSGSKKRKRKHHKNKAPKPGQEGFKTATQLRNARKRRAKKQNKQAKDPSQLFLANPKGAPIVQTARAFFKKHCQIDFSVTMGPSQGWRSVAKLAVRPSHDGQVSIGLFAPNSHKLIAVPECKAHHPSINVAVEKLERVCRQLNVQPFDETTGKGHLRHVAINVEPSTVKVQMTLVWNSQSYSDDADAPNKGKQELDTLCRALIGSSGRKASGRKRRRGRQSTKESTEDAGNDKPRDLMELHSLWVHYNNAWKHSNSIFSIDGGKDSWEHRFGLKCITEVLDLKESGLKYPVSLRFPPNVFRQANIDAFTKIVARIRDRLSRLIRERRKSDRTATLPTICELYGGVGTIGLNLADLSSSLVSSDENPFNEACFNESASELPAHVSQRVSYKPLNATEMVQSGALDGADVVIVDPPRKGLDDAVLKTLCTEPSPRLLVYVSCGFNAFQRDCSALLNSTWQLEEAEGHLLFPGSDAIETLAFFVRMESN